MVRDVGLCVRGDLWCLARRVLRFELIWKSVGLVILPPCCRAAVKRGSEQVLMHIRVCCSLLVIFSERKI